MISIGIGIAGILLLILGSYVIRNSKTGVQSQLGALIAIIGFTVLALGAFVRAAGAHDHASPVNNEWLKSLTSKNKTLCCDGNDTDAIEDWETKDSRYRVKFRGQWFDVPDDALVDDAKKGVEALLWMNKGYSGVSVRCFKPGSMT